MPKVIHEYDIDQETDEEYICGASIDLQTLFDELGYIPHPSSMCNNPPVQQEVWITLTKHNEQDGKRIPLRGHELSIPGILSWIGTNIGFYDHDHEHEDANENGFVCTVENDTIDMEESRFFVFWRE